MTEKLFGYVRVQWPALSTRGAAESCTTDLITDGNKWGRGTTYPKQLPALQPCRFRAALASVAHHSLGDGYFIAYISRSMLGGRDRLVLNQIRIGRDRGDGVCVWRLGQ